MVNKSTNICFIIEDLLKTNSFSEIGKVFSEGLKRKKRDVIAFETIDINRLRHIQSDTMRKMKSYMIMTNIHNQTPYEIEFKRELNKNSLLGLIKE